MDLILLNDTLDAIIAKGDDYCIDCDDCSNCIFSQDDGDTCYMFNLKYALGMIQD